MTRYIQDKNGRFAGSIGQGRDAIPVPAYMVVPLTPQEQYSMTFLADALTELRANPTLAPAIDALRNAAPVCAWCGLHGAYGEMNNCTLDGDLEYLCWPCRTGEDTHLVTCDVCLLLTDNYYWRELWLEEDDANTEECWPHDATSVCLRCANQLG